MLWPGIKKLGKKLHLKRTDSEAVGMVKNSFVRLYDGKNIKVLEIYFPSMDENDKEELTKKLTLYKIKKYDWMYNSIKITFREIIRSYPIKIIDNLLNEIVNYFNNKYPVLKPQCQRCESEKEAELIFVNNESLFICNDCYRELEININKENMKWQNTPNNYLLGFLGTFLFSLPGILLTTAFFIFLNSLAAVSALLYVFLGTIGYKKFKGKINPVGVSIILINGIIMVTVGIFVSYSIFILKEIKTIDIDSLIYILKLPEVQKELVTNIVMSYVICSFYFIFQFFQMFKEWEGKKIIHKGRDI